MRVFGYSETMPDDNAPASSIVSMGLGLLVAVGIVLFAGIGAIIGHTVFDDIFGWGQDPLVGAAIGLIIGIGLAFVSVGFISGRLKQSGN